MLTMVVFSELIAPGGMMRLSTGPGRSGSAWTMSAFIDSARFRVRVGTAAGDRSLGHGDVLLGHEPPDRLAVSAWVELAGHGGASLADAGRHFWMTVENRLGRSLREIGKDR